MHKCLKCAVCAAHECLKCAASGCAAHECLKCAVCAAHECLKCAASGCAAVREPEVTVSHQMIGVYLGDDVTVNCTATSYPPPVVLWKDSHGKIIISGQ